MNYSDEKYPLQRESYEIIGICMEVHRILGKGLLEVVYKDAIEYEFRKRNIPFEREKKYEIQYKDVILPHYYHADFVIDDEIILEIKAQKGSLNNNLPQVLNYLAISKCPLGLLINFGDDSLETKRVVL